MASIQIDSGAPALTSPIPSSERIQALDVVRGFALIGIFLMNIEWFNRPIAELGGLPTSVHGADYWAGYLIYILVQGKFWTMFSFLFGMGFAVMLTRAERAGRSFLVPYIRRIAALAVFGALHHVFLWAGDILFSYAVAALCLLLLLWARWWAILGLVLLGVVLAVAGLPDVGGPLASGLAIVGLAALFLRDESRAGGSGPYWSSVPFFVTGAIGVGVAILAGLVGFIPGEARWPAAIVASLLLLVGVLAERYKQPIEPRPRRLGVAMYIVPFLIMLSFGLLQVFGPQLPKPSEAQVQAALVTAKAERAEREAAELAPPPSAKEKTRAEAQAKAKAEADKKKSPTEKAAMREANRRLNRAEHDERVVEERALQKTGSYADFVRFRAKDFAENAPGEFGFAAILLGMFLLGYWFVRTGIMERTGEHLPLFRKLATIGLPIGVGLGIVGSLIATHPTPGMTQDPFQVAMSLLMIGNLPACLGYVSLIVLMLHSSSVFNRIRVLAPLGRMALTNYLTHSVVASMFFFGYGLGNYGMGRAAQVGFVFAVIALQVVFCHWWLSKFRYGPMEWLWRAITYWQLPAMRRGAEPALEARAVA
jgi:uncharacterized membrane protein YeiB